MIRLAQSEHLNAINKIYNQAVEDGLRTAHTQPLSLQERKRWFNNHSSTLYPVFVYQQDDDVIGWLSISPYRSDREALDDVVEISYYVDYNHHGEGIGSKLMQYGLDFCSSAPYRIVVAILINSNETSIKLLEKFGFVEGGRIPDAIHYEGEFRDHLYMFKKLNIPSQ
ncbi:GNAT family N-acetyltransferase [Fodinibius halophilus]|uniref:N-acetyltransferase n=1 Tax=Fodinibius halophilus TaxID=1736908 RepID=A0A6M1SYU3_9BACT|nr:GNAT family N-acetyltransferase [Fodinibius halophilus]NGP86789.1 N-acetyltransferase [Fodinibius halophilus]